MRVLIAEARPSTRGALRALLEHDPSCDQVIEATDAQSVLTALRAAPDMLLLDWGLPGLATEALVARVRELRPALIIVALGHHQQTRRAALAVGADCYIDTSQPPVDFMDLLHRLCPDVLEALRPSSKPTPS